jgi:hypothetical protein
MYIYIQSKLDLWTVGFYSPTGKWVAESDHNSPEAAAERVRYLNGGNQPSKNKLCKRFGCSGKVYANGLCKYHSRT